MLVRTDKPIPSSEITPESAYLNRRKFLAGAAALGATAATARVIGQLVEPATHALADTKLQIIKSPYSTSEAQTSLQNITHYNNFYEFGTDKTDPARTAVSLKIRPWTVTSEGLCKNQKAWDIDTLLKYRPQEERVYRFRCVEGWSMVIPWAGYSLSEFIKACDPLPSAKYVQFLSLADPKQPPYLHSVHMNWPYSEGLRMDEAMHPLTLLTFGLYGQTLPNQDGAPVRVIVPWKYGFKSGKSIVKIRFVAQEPPTAWDTQAPNEYGFYSNVNPNVDHPRWSQKTERVIGAPLFHQTKATQIFNGYGDQVAHLYSGMDLKKYY